MKIALLNDVHLGARSDSDRIAAHQEEFFSGVFFPYLKKHEIKTVFILGDVFDRRKFINFKTLARAREMLFDPMQHMGITAHVSAGNHCIYHSNTSEINSLELLLKEYKNLKIYARHSEEIDFDGYWVGVVPWITPENRSECETFIKRTLCPTLFGHFDINGFEMNPGIVCEHGEDPNIFERFEHVLSGHYHKKMSNGNITYLGTQYQMDWGDYGVKKFFHVFDTEEASLTAVENQNPLFYKIYYNGEKTASDFSMLKDKYVKVVVLNKGDPQKFEKFVSEIKEQNPESLSIVDLPTENVSLEGASVEDKTTLNLIDDYLEGMQTLTEDHKKDVRSTLAELYQEASALGAL